MKPKTINIHGKEYMPVSERVLLAHQDCKQISINTEILNTGEIVVVKATVITPKGTFTGISAANPAKAIEKMSPYEVAETSAVGRALGFAGYGIVEGIASADEVVKATTPETTPLPKAPNHNITPRQLDRVMQISRTKEDKLDVKDVEEWSKEKASWYISTNGGGYNENMKKLEKDETINF